MRIHHTYRVLPALLLLCQAGWSAAQSAQDAQPTTRPDAPLLWTQDLANTFEGNVNLDKKFVFQMPQVEAEKLQTQLDLQLVNLQWRGVQSAAYLGVGVESPNETLRSQLRLPEGAGLVVNYVDDKGPSKDAVRKHDVLQKLDDQILVNGEQLITLVRMHKPDETVSLTLIREAKPLTVQVKLGTKQEDAAQSWFQAVQPQQFVASSAPVGNLLVAMPQGAGVPVLKEIPLINKLFVNRLADAELKGRPITFNDGELLACIDGSGNLVAIEVKTGNVIFHGPITTEEQWKNAPQLVRDKLSAWKSLIASPDPASDKDRSGAK